MATFSLAIFYKMLKKAGAERVSDEAVEALREVVEELSEEIARKIVKVAEHTGRKTIMARDVELVLGKKE